MNELYPLLALTLALGCVNQAKSETPNPTSDLCDKVELDYGAYSGNVDGVFSLYSMDKSEKLNGPICTLVRPIGNFVLGLIDFNCDNKTDYFFLNNALTQNGDVTPVKEKNEYFDNLLKQGQKLVCPKNRMPDL